MTDIVQCMDDGGRAGRIGGVFFALVCAQNYYSAQFIMSIQGPIPGITSPTGLTGDWGGELSGS